MAAAAAGLAACLATPVCAAETLWTSYLRVGPGQQFSVMQELPRRTALDVVGCESGWCQVRLGTAVGYLRQSLVGEPGAPVPASTSAPDCFETVITGHPGGSHVRICRR